MSLKFFIRVHKRQLKTSRKSYLYISLLPDQITTAWKNRERKRGIEREREREGKNQSRFISLTHFHARRRDRIIPVWLYTINSLSIQLILSPTILEISNNLPINSFETSGPIFFKRNRVRFDRFSNRAVDLNSFSSRFLASRRNDRRGGGGRLIIMYRCKIAKPSTPIVRVLESQSSGRWKKRRRVAILSIYTW